MTTILARLNLYNDVRKTPFNEGYRPTFDFGEKSLTSGRISLLNGKKSFFPGEEDDVKITFLSNEFFGKKLKKGNIIVFTEGLIPVGEIKILEIISHE